MSKPSHKLLFFVAVGIGVLMLVLAISMRPKVPTKPAQTSARAVDVVTLEMQQIAPEIIGFGRAAPKRSWQAIAEVGGKVIYRHPKLEKGQVVAAGELLLQLDPADYQLAVAKAQAELSATQVKLAKLARDEENIELTLKIERRQLELEQQELKRQQNLRDKKLASQSAMDNAQQALLSQQNRVQELENRQRLLPDEKNIILAELQARRLSLAQAQRDLAKTNITLPLNGRIAEVNIEKDQLVTPQKVMLIAHGLGAVEVTAHVSIHDLQLLLSEIEPATSTFSNKIQSLGAEVMLTSGNFSRRWPAKVVRLSDSANPNQATVGVILEVPLNQEMEQGIHATPSLVSGMFVQARILGQAQSHWVVPERAIHGNKIYLVENNALKILPVEVLFRQNEQVVIAGELRAGMQVVINDLLPALSGMALSVYSIDGNKVEAPPQTEQTKARALSEVNA